MPSPEIPLALTPRQDPVGGIVTVPLPTGTTRIRIPAAKDGHLVRARVGEHEVLLRIRVTPGGIPNGRAWPGLLGIAAVTAFAV